MADSASYNILVTTRVMFIGLVWTLFHFKSKTKGYNFHEDTHSSSQLIKVEFTDFRTRMSLSVWLSALNSNGNNSGYTIPFEVFSDALESWNIGLKVLCFGQRLIWYGSKWKMKPKLCNLKTVRKTIHLAVKGIFVISHDTVVRLNWNFIGSYKTSFPTTLMF